MDADALAALGLELRAQADAWLEGLLGAWSLPGAQAAAEPLAELALLEAEVASLAGQVAELERLQTSLTAGFPGISVPAALDGEVADEEAGPDPRSPRQPRGRAGGQDGGGARIPPSPRSSPETSRSSASAPSIGSQGGRADVDRAWKAAPAPSPRSAAAPATSRDPSTARRTDLPFSAPLGEREAADWGDAAAGGRSPAARGPDAGTPAGGGIRGLGDLAMLAGSRGLDLPTDTPQQPVDSVEWNAPQPDGGSSVGQGRWEGANLPGPASAWDGFTSDEGSRPGPASRDDATRSTPSAGPIRLRRWEPPESRGPLASQEEADDPEGDSREAWSSGAARDERRWIDLPASIARRQGDRGISLELPTPIAFPFLSMPGEPAKDLDATPDAGGASPAERRGVFGEPAGRRPEGFPAPQLATLDDLGVDAAGVPSLAIARAAGRRVRPAAEILAALGDAPLAVDSAPRLEGSTEWATLTPEPAERAVPEPGAAPDPRPRAAEDEVPLAIVRSVESAAPDTLPEPLSWPDLDVQDLMDALAREIMHEYRRHYGV